MEDEITKIIEDVGTKYQVESGVVYRIMEVIKKRDKNIIAKVRKLDEFDPYYQTACDDIEKELEASRAE